MQIKNVIPFSKLRHAMYTLSIISIIVVWVVTFVTGGFNLGIDFKPGLSQQISVNAGSADIDHVRKALDTTEFRFSVQPVGSITLTVASREFRTKTGGGSAAWDENDTQTNKEAAKRPAREEKERKGGVPDVDGLS